MRLFNRLGIHPEEIFLEDEPMSELIPEKPSAFYDAMPH
jgi:hypothetical protein